MGLDDNVYNTCPKAQALENVICFAYDGASSANLCHHVPLAQAPSTLRAHNKHLSSTLLQIQLHLPKQISEESQTKQKQNKRCGIMN